MGISNPTGRGCWPLLVLIALGPCWTCSLRNSPAPHRPPPGQGLHAGRRAPGGGLPGVRGAGLHHPGGALLHAGQGGPEGHAGPAHEVFAHLMKRSTDFFHRNPVGRLMTRVTSDVQNLNEMFASGSWPSWGTPSPSLPSSSGCSASTWAWPWWRWASCRCSSSPPRSSGATPPWPTGRPRGATPPSRPTSRSSSPGCPWCR